MDLDRARRAVVDSIIEIGKEWAGIINAYGRTLGEDVEAGSGLPRVDTAAGDGYAALSRDLLGASQNEPRALSVLADSSLPEKRLAPGTAIRVRPGDPLPGGADTVVDLSKTYRPQNGVQLLVLSESRPHENVQPAGSVVPTGVMVLRKGVRITGLEMALLASLGKPGIRVSRKPRVAVITTGAAVVEVVDEISAGEVRNIHRYALVGMILESGCELGRLIHVRDGRVGLEKAIADCGDCRAVVVVLGPGDRHDLTVQALENSGEARFARVDLDPGASTALAICEGRPVFVVPGQAVLEVFEALVRPGLLTMLGRSIMERPTVKASLECVLKINPASHHLVKAVTSYDSGGYTTRNIARYSPEAPAWTLPNSLISIPPGIDMINRGSVVDVALLSSV